MVDVLQSKYYDTYHYDRNSFVYEHLIHTIMALQ